jgi:hypothetical protein
MLDMFEKKVTHRQIEKLCYNLLNLKNERHTVLWNLQAS